MIFITIFKYYIRYTAKTKVSSALIENAISTSKKYSSLARFHKSTRWKQKKIANPSRPLGIGFHLECSRLGKFH